MEDPLRMNEMSRDEQHLAELFILGQERAGAVKGVPKTGGAALGVAKTVGLPRGLQLLEGRPRG